MVVDLSAGSEVCGRISSGRADVMSHDGLIRNDLNG